MMTAAFFRRFAVLACAAALTACAGKAEPPVALTRGDPHNTDPNRIVCRQLPPPTGSLISQNKPVCHTYAEWQQLTRTSQETMRNARPMSLPARSGVR